MVEGLDFYPYFRCVCVCTLCMCTHEVCVWCGVVGRVVFVFFIGRGPLNYKQNKFVCTGG